jgi:hypothetical protein
LFARWNQPLRRNLNSNRLCCFVSDDFPILHARIMRVYDSAGAGLSFSLKTSTGMVSQSAALARS